MTISNIRLANEARLASEELSREIGTSNQLVHFQQIAVTNVGSQPLPIGVFLKNTESAEMAIDGTSPLNFDIAPGANEVYRINKLSIVAVLATSPTMLEFGDIPALGTGLSLQIVDEDDAVISDLLGGVPIVSNNDLATIGEIYLHEFGASYTLKAIIDLPSPIRLEGGYSEKLRMTVSDNLASIDRLRVFASGQREDVIT